MSNSPEITNEEVIDQVKLKSPYIRRNFKTL